MFGRITEGELLDSAIVAPNKIKRSHNHAELNQIDDEELKRRGVKRVVPKPTCHSVDSEPAYYIEKKIEHRRRPFMTEKMRPQGSGLATGDRAAGLADMYSRLLFEREDFLRDRLRFFAVRHEAGNYRLKHAK